MLPKMIISNSFIGLIKGRCEIIIITTTCLTYLLLGNIQTMPKINDLRSNLFFSQFWGLSGLSWTFLISHIDWDYNHLNTQVCWRSNIAHSHDWWVMLSLGAKLAYMAWARPVPVFARFSAKWKYRMSC